MSLLPWDHEPSSKDGRNVVRSQSYVVDCIPNLWRLFPKLVHCLTTLFTKECRDSSVAVVNDHVQAARVVRVDLLEKIFD